jgi:hypothetical protein
MLKVPPKVPKSEPKSRSLSETVLSDAVGISQPVEKDDVGPVDGPKEVRNKNKAKTLRKRRFQPLVQRLKRALRSFSTRCSLPGT